MLSRFPRVVSLASLKRLCSALFNRALILLPQPVSNPILTTNRVGVVHGVVTRQQV
jgi:hypothetical protein